MKSWLVLQQGNTDSRTALQAQRFAAVIIRIRDPKTTALVFASGKMVCNAVDGCNAVHSAHISLMTFPFWLEQVVTGAKSEDSARQAARKASGYLCLLSLESDTSGSRTCDCTALCLAN